MSAFVPAGNLLILGTYQKELFMATNLSKVFRGVRTNEAETRLQIAQSQTARAAEAQASQERLEHEEHLKSNSWLGFALLLFLMLALVVRATGFGLVGIALEWLCLIGCGAGVSAIVNSRLLKSTRSDLFWGITAGVSGILILLAALVERAILS